MKTKTLDTGVVITLNKKDEIISVVSPYYKNHYKKPYSRVTMMLNYLFKNMI